MTGGLGILLALVQIILRKCIICEGSLMKFISTIRFILLVEPLKNTRPVFQVNKGTSNIKLLSQKMFFTPAFDFHVLTCGCHTLY